MKRLFFIFLILPICMLASCARESSPPLTDDSTSESGNIKYSVDCNYEAEETVSATITAETNGQTLTKEVEMSALIAKAGTTSITEIGDVAYVSETGGEYYSTHFYSLVGKEIDEIGTISIVTRPETEYLISALDNGKVGVNISSEIGTFEGSIDADYEKTKAVSIPDCGNFIFIDASTSSEKKFIIWGYEFSDLPGGSGLVECGSLIIKH